MIALRRVSCGFAWIVLVPVAALAQAEPAPKELPFAGPPPPAELQVLAPLVGQWTTKIAMRPSLQDKEGYVATGQSTGQWLHNRQFLRLEGTVTGSKYRGESTLLYSYDARRQVYRRWLFMSSGLVTESEGRWDADRRTMTWKALGLAPNTTGTVTDVVGEDRLETTVLVKRDDGQVLVDGTFTAERRK